MLSIFWRMLKDRKTSILVYCLSGILLLWMYIAMFPSIKEQAEFFSEMISRYPEGLMKAFGISQDLNFTYLENFLAMEQFSLVWPIIVMFMMISLAGSAISGEIEKGTAEILLSRPVSRLKIFFGKYFAGIFSLLVFTLTSVFAVIPLAKLHKIDYILENYVSLAIIGFLFGWAILSLAMMFSALFSEKSKTFMLSAGVLVAMYVLNVMASLKENLQDLKFLSFFHYYDYSQALIHNTINLDTIWIFSAAIIFCTFIGVIWFHKRDIAV